MAGPTRQGRLALAGRVRTLDPAVPCVDGLVIENGLVHALTSAPGAWRLPPGAVVVPGFEDPHVHLLAAAAARRSIDCGAPAVPDLASLELRIATRARRGHGWLRGAGFDDALVAERRAPDRLLLDRAGPGRPLVIHHAAGVVAYCNSEALRTLGVDPERDDGTDGVERAGDGSATGRVDKRSEVLAGVPVLDERDRHAALDETAYALLSAGVTAVTDATVTNDPDAIGVLAGWADGTPGPRLSVMIGAAFLSRRSLSIPDRVRPVYAKVVVEGDDPPDLVEIVARSRALGVPVALHVTDVDTLDRALTALAASPSTGRCDRLEHVSLCLPEQVAMISASNAIVVTQPAFVRRRSAKYAEQLTEVELDWLYRVRSLLDAGVVVAASSDAPVVSARPLESMAAAVDRDLNPSERVDPGTALAMVTTNAAAASGTGGGSLRIGGPADFVVLSADPLEVDVADLDAIAVLATVIGGQVVYRDPALTGLG